MKKERQTIYTFEPGDIVTLRTYNGVPHVPVLRGQDRKWRNPWDRNVAFDDDLVEDALEANKAYYVGNFKQDSNW